MIKKMIKSTRFVFLCLILIFLTVFGVFAEAYKSYTVDELGMEIALPADMYAITRQSQSTDAVFSELNIDYVGKIAAMQNENMYLQGIANDESVVVGVTMVQDESSEQINDFRLLKDSQLNTILESYMSQGYTDGSISEYNGIVYCDLRLTHQVNSVNVYAAQSNTVVNGMNVNITVQSIGDELTDDELKMTQKILHSVKFKENSEVNKRKAAAIIWVIAIFAVLIVIALFAWYFYMKKKIKNDRPSRIALERTRQKDKIEEEYGYDSDEFVKNDSLLNEKDINVKDGTVSGLTYFEDNGKDVLESNEYFNDYFANSKQTRVSSSPKKSITKTVKNAYTRTGYFITNVSRLIKRKGKNKQRNKKQ